MALGATVCRHPFLFSSCTIVKQHALDSMKQQTGAIDRKQANTPFRGEQTASMSRSVHEKRDKECFVLLLRIILRRWDEEQTHMNGCAHDGDF
jgi:hypothetical protein